MQFERRLTDLDKLALKSYREKCSQVRAFTVAVLRGTHTGMLLFGSGGNGKSYSIREELQERGIKELQPEDTAADADDEEDGERVPEEHGYDTWVSHQGRITPKGLVKEMARFPRTFHLVEDAETMFDDKNCWGVLRMALHSQDHALHPRRRITWTISTKDSYDFWFTGALVIVGNRLLNDKMVEVEAVKTRCPSMNFDVLNVEIIAKMKEMCLNGYRGIATVPLTVGDCFDVLEFLLTAIEGDPELKRDARGKEKKLNLRILISGFRFLALSRLEHCIDWRAMLLAQMSQLVGASKRSRAERIHDEVKIAQDIAAKRWPSQHAKLVEWCRLTGRDGDWADCPRDSDEYARGFRAAKTDFGRKNK